MNYKTLKLADKLLPKFSLFLAALCGASIWGLFKGMEYFNHPFIAPLCIAGVVFVVTSKIWLEPSLSKAVVFYETEILDQNDGATK